MTIPAVTASRAPALAKAWRSRPPDRTVQRAKLRAGFCIKTTITDPEIALAACRSQFLNCFAVVDKDSTSEVVTPIG